MSRRTARVFALTAALTLGSAVARGQQPTRVEAYSGPHSVYGAPGWYGVSYGVPSYGVARKYSEFSSPYGAGYGYGYIRPAILPGAHGAGLWTPSASPGYGYGRQVAYRTFPAESWPRPVPVGPPVGVYAPGFGPSMWPAW